MTRLTENDINSLAHDVAEFEERLIELTGQDMLGIACHGAGVSKKTIQDNMKNIRLACVSMTCGLGQISGFSHTLADILTHMGFDAFVPGHTDAAGIAQAVEKKAKILFMADDLRYIALNLKKTCVIDNGAATGNVFAAALDLMAKGVKERPALVLGCGPVGRAAARTLVRFGACVGIHDQDRKKCENFCADLERQSPLRIERVHELSSVGNVYDLFVEATPAKDILTSAMTGSSSFVAAPGVPLGVSAEAVEKAGSRILYDPLQLGTAAMAVMALCPPYTLGKTSGNSPEPLSRG